MERTDVPRSWDERATVQTFLTYARATAVAKCEGLSDEAARKAPLPDSPLMTIAGLISHLRWVEHWWFEVVFLGEDVRAPWSEEAPDMDFTPDPSRTLADVVDEYTRACAEIDRKLADHDLDELSARKGRAGHEFTLRWVFGHLIEETSRHNGHLDVVRELIDGVKGV
ncbi:DinB family protein [Nonomuraea sp. NPDC004354]